MKKLLLATVAALLICGQVEAASICDNANGNPNTCVIPNADGSISIGGNTYKNITTGTTTVVKSGSGTLATILLNTFVASATITIYDNTAASGTKIATITLPSTITGAVPDEITFNVKFTTGLTIVTSGATDITAAYR